MAFFPFLAMHYFLFELKPIAISHKSSETYVAVLFPCRHHATKALVEMKLFFSLLLKRGDRWQWCNLSPDNTSHIICIRKHAQKEGRQSLAPLNNMLASVYCISLIKASCVSLRQESSSRSFRAKPVILLNTERCLFGCNQVLSSFTQTQN